MRLIDADALEKFLENTRSHLPYQSYKSTMELDIRDNALLNLQQMVHLRKPVDAVPVVRCKDCKYCHAGYCEKSDDLIPRGNAEREWENWFCADGERSGK